MTRPRATVVICAYTLARWELLSRSIESALDQAPGLIEVVVVSDHNPELLDRLRSTAPGPRIIENDNARGLSGARNSGVAAATGDVIAFLDDDAAAEPGWLETLLRHYVDPAVLGVGGAIEPEWAVGRPRWFPPEFDWVIGCTYRGMPRHLAAVRNPIGANMSFRRSLFEVVGGFRDGLGRVGETPVGGEETELCIRASRHVPGARFLFDPRAIVRHHVPAGRGTWRYFVRRCYAEGLSKAAITRSVGSGAGLASERGYATRTLPAGVLGGIAHVFRGDFWGAARAAAIVIGLAVTTAGYVVGSVRPAAPPPSAQPGPSGVGPS